MDGAAWRICSSDSGTSLRRTRVLLAKRVARVGVAYMVNSLIGWDGPRWAVPVVLSGSVAQALAVGRWALTAAGRGSSAASISAMKACRSRRAWASALLSR